MKRHAAPHACASLVAALLLLAGLAGAQPKIEILRTGVFHGDEVPYNNAERWLALVEDSAGSVLREVSVRIEPVRDEILDEGAAKTGRKVSHPLEPIFFLRGSRAFAPGRLKTAVVLPHFALGGSELLSFGGRDYRFTLQETRASVVAEQRQMEAGLFIEIGNERQLLATYTLFEGTEGTMLFSGHVPPSLLWAGDLDGDQRLDFFLNTSDHENVAESALFLSSEARTGECVRRVAVFRAVGC